MHYNLTLITNSIDKTSIEFAMNPYIEGNEDDLPKEQLDFHDTEDSNKLSYESDTITQLKYGNDFYTYSDIKESKDSNLKNAVKVKRKLTDVYPTFEIYMEQYLGYRKRDPEMGRYGYWENNNAKWDWYVIGGRWKGSYIVEKNAISLHGDPGSFGYPYWGGNPIPGHVRCNGAKVKDIRFNTMKTIGNPIATHAVLDSIHDVWEEAPSYEECFNKDRAIWNLNYEQAENKWNNEFFDRFIKDLDPELYLVLIDCHI